MRSAAAMVAQLCRAGVFAAGLTALVVPMTAYAQPRGGDVCFFEHANFQGRRFCIGVGQRVPFVGPAYNDMFSSVTMPPGVRVTVCQHENFGGRCVTLDRTVTDFQSIGLNDQVSAVAAEPGRPGREPGRPGPGWDRPGMDRPGPGPRPGRDEDMDDEPGPSPAPGPRPGPDWDRRDRPPGWDRRSDDRPRGPGGGQVCFYQHENFGGRSYCVPVGQPISFVGEHYNDIFSSMTAPPGAVVTACEHANFGGRCRTFSGSLNYLGDGWNDMISSFRSSWR